MKKDEFDDSLLELWHPSQVEQRYGGDAPDVTEYWPPYSPSEEYGHLPECIVDGDEPPSEVISQDDSVFKSYSNIAFYFLL